MRCIASGARRDAQKKERVLIMPISEAVPRACVCRMGERAPGGALCLKDRHKAVILALPLYDDGRKCGTFPRWRRLAVAKLSCRVG